MLNSGAIRVFRFTHSVRFSSRTSCPTTAFQRIFASLIIQIDPLVSVLSPRQKKKKKNTNAQTRTRDRLENLEKPCDAFRFILVRSLRFRSLKRRRHEQTRCTIVWTISISRPSVCFSNTNREYRPQTNKTSRRRRTGKYHVEGFGSTRSGCREGDTALYSPAIDCRAAVRISRRHII